MPLKCEKLCTLSSLSSKFSDLKVLAGGGNGVVFSGVDKSLSEGSLSEKENSAVALKRLSLVGKGHCRVALRELRLLKRFQHDNIVRTIKITDSNGSTIEDPSMENFKDMDSVFVVEELLDTDLHKIIERNGKLSIETTKLFMYQLLRGLKYIHSANVVHRDIKPGNLFVNADDLTLKIGDYGLARVFDNRYRHRGYLTAIVSTRYYRAPEVMLSLGDYNVSIDIWSAGCVLGEMLLGKVMFPGENDLDQINVICSSYGLKIDDFYGRESSFPEHWFDGLPPEAIDLLTKMLCIDPSERITAEEALSHSFFSELHDEIDESICEQPFFIEHEIDNLPMKILKRKILRSSCLNSFEKKSYYSSDESLFKDFDETFVTSDAMACTRKMRNIKLNSRGEETEIFRSWNTSTNDTSTESSVSHQESSLISNLNCGCDINTDGFLPSLKDAMSREELIDEPFKDPGVCERKYHESSTIYDLPSINLCTAEIKYSQSIECQQTSYFSDLSPVIEVTDSSFPTDIVSSSSFLEIPGRSCAINNYVNENDSHFDKKSTNSKPCRNEIKSLNEAILRTLSERSCTGSNCRLEDFMSEKLSKTSAPFVHWDSIRFWI